MFFFTFTNDTVDLLTVEELFATLFLPHGKSFLVLFIDLRGGHMVYLSVWSVVFEEVVADLVEPQASTLEIFVGVELSVQVGFALPTYL